MSVHTTERDSKCVGNQESRAQKLTGIVGRLKSNFDWLAFQAMVVYWVLTWLLYPAFFAFEQVDAGMISLALYYLSCALISSLAIVYIFYSIIFTSCHSSKHQKATALVLLLITIDNVIMAADAIAVIGLCLLAYLIYY
jgi:hypothetical protein